MNAPRAGLDRRIAVLAVLGFGSGLPLALTGDTLQAWLRTAGYDLVTVGLITLVGLPYSFQVLWAPIMDRWSPRLGRLGRRRSWIVLTQLIIALAIAGVALSGPSTPAPGRTGQSSVADLGAEAPPATAVDADAIPVPESSGSAGDPVTTELAVDLGKPASDPRESDASPPSTAREGIAAAVSTPRPLIAVSLFALILAFFSASQDIVSNAYRADIVTGRERGPAASVYVIGYRLAMVATGAGVLALADFLPWTVAYLCAAAAMGPVIIATLLAPDPPPGDGAPATLSEAILAPLARFIGSPAGLVTLAFVLVFRLPDAMGNRMTMPLLQDLGYTLGQIALVRQAIGLAITMLGALVAGFVVVRLGLMGGLVIFAILQMVSNAGFIVLALSEPGSASVLKMGIVIGIESFCGGLAAAGFVAYLMACCERRYSAMQYALLISFVDLGGRLAGAMTGFIAERTGYPIFFAITIAVGIPGLLLLPWARLGIVDEE